jgi:hypothetical protein
VSKAKTTDLAAAVMARARNNCPGFVPWYRRIPAADLAQLESLRSRWASGELPIQKRALARAIIDECHDRGLTVSGIQGVEDWLNLAVSRTR